MSDVPHYCPKLQDDLYAPVKHKTHVRSSFVFLTAEVATSIIDPEANLLNFSSVYRHSSEESGGSVLGNVHSLFYLQPK